MATAMPVSTVARALVVVQRYVVPGLDRVQIAYYEIHLALDHAADRPRLIFLTRDHDVYVTALLAEGLPVRYDARWRHGRRADGKPCHVLEALEAAV